jgi:hypothetical protein
MASGVNVSNLQYNSFCRNSKGIQKEKKKKLKKYLESVGNFYFLCIKGCELSVLYRI